MFFLHLQTAGPNKVKFFMSMLYLMYNLFELFIFCKWCDEIKLQVGIDHYLPWLTFYFAGSYPSNFINAKVCNLCMDTYILTL